MKLSNRAFTLAELMITAGILALVLSGLLLIFTNCILLNETNRNLALAYSAIEAKMEEIRTQDFNGLNGLNGTSLPLGQGLNGNMSIEVTNLSGTLKRIRLAACFMNRNRLFGNNLNNCQTSPVELTTLITR